ncbi:MAG: 7-cyano-7-deazaguanine synthase QueC [Nitrospirota bacterium]
MSQVKAVVLLSGGIDSTTTMAIAKSEGCELYALTIDYGQRHVHEIEKARLVSSFFNAKKQIVVSVNLREIGGSALTSSIEVPANRTQEEISHGIPVTYVPARNTIFLAIALSWAEVIDADTIFFGANVVDYSGYPDCRPEYIRAFEYMANLGTRKGVEGLTKFSVKTPLINMTKAEIIIKGVELGVDYSLTHSCYDPGEAGIACGRCDSCLIRKKGFIEAGITDPVRYAL